MNRKSNKGCESIGKYISTLYRSGNAYFSKEFSKYNIGSGQFFFLTYLYANDGVIQEEISYNLNVDKGTTARAIKKLEEEGYVYRKVDEEDKRAYKVYITDKALSIKEGIYATLKKWNSIIAYGFSEEEKEITLRLLQRMVENQKRYSVKGADFNGKR